MTRRILGVFLAIILAILGTVAVLFYVNRAQNTVAAGQTAVKVLIATQRIPAGTTGKSLRSKGFVEEVVMPAGSLPDDVLTSIPSELDELVVTYDVQPRQLLLKGMFGAATKLSGGIAVPEKMLAVSFKFAVEEEVGGFVRPGSRVAVFGTMPYGQKGSNVLPPITRLLVPRVEVLAVGAYGEGGVTSTGQDDGEKATTVTLIVTVAVTQADAEKLIHAARGAELYLALLTDSSEVRQGSGVDNQTLVG